MREDTYRLPINDSIKTAWQKVSGAKGTIWAVTLSFVVVIFLLFMLEQWFPQNQLIVFINFIVQTAFSLALLYLGIKRAQNLPIRYNMIKEALTLRTFLFYIVMLILKVLLFAVIGIIEYFLITNFFATTFESLNFLSVIICILCVIPFIFLTIRLCLSDGIVVAKQLNPWKALKLSYQATKHNFWQLLALFFIGFVVVTASTLTLGIAFIWTLPWMCIIYGEMYNRLMTLPTPSSQEVLIS